MSVRVKHYLPVRWLDELLGTASDAALDGSQERHSAIATGLTTLDATDTHSIFIYIVPFGAIFSDKLKNIFLKVAREVQQALESGFSESLVRVASIYSRTSLPASSSLLAGDELVRTTEEDLRGAVPALFAAEGTFDRDGLEWKFLRT